MLTDLTYYHEKIEMNINLKSQQKATSSRVLFQIFDKNLRKNAINGFQM